jgi:glycosyltransferase involved in cell wall biosynthesis
MSKPFISVLIDTYNHERFIEQAIVSVLEQGVAESDREIIVVDDGSTDRTSEIVRGFEPRVRLIRKANGGQASAFNTGIPECSGEIIAFLDGDDWWTPGKLQAVGDVLSGNAKVGLVGHGIIEVFSDGACRAQAPEKDERLRLDSVEAARVFRLRKSYLGTSRMTLRAELARKILPIPEALVIEADEYLFTIAAAVSDVVILRNTLTYYHIHGGNLYIAAGDGEAGLRRKNKVMEALAKTLNAALSIRGVPTEAIECTVELIRAEADQLRLMLDGGTPWETVRAETTLYRILHGDAGMPQRIFRRATMVPAMILPPRWFYAARRWLGSHPQYHRVREKVLPVPKITHAAGPDEYKA